MSEVFSAFHKGLRDIFVPRVLAMVLAPILCALALWMLVGWLFWAQFTAWVSGGLMSSQAGQWVADYSQGVLQFGATLIALALLAPCMLITAMVITELVTMPALVNHVAAHDHPMLARLHGGTVAGGIANALIAIVIFGVLWIVTLPLWFTGIGALIVPVLNSAYLSQRVFRHDVLADHASPEELQALNTANRRTLFALGLVTAVFFYVPVVNLLAPAFTGLAFTHFQLGRLAKLRQK